jgi:hypothetical protein
MVSHLRKEAINTCFVVNVKKEDVVIHGKIQGYKVLRPNRESVFFPLVHGEYKVGEKYAAAENLESWKETWRGQTATLIFEGFHGWKKKADAVNWLKKMATPFCALIVPVIFYDAIIGDTGEIVSREMEIGEGIVT